MEIFEDNANVSSRYSWLSAKIGGLGFSEFQLRKIDAIKLGYREWKLAKPVWRIKYEITRLAV